MQKKIETFKCMQNAKREKRCEKVLVTEIHDFEYQIEKVDSLVMLRTKTPLRNQFCLSFSELTW